MAAEKPPQIYCLFHQKKECPCIAPPTNEKMLNYRLESSIRNNELNNKFETDPAEKARREVEIENWRARLAAGFQNP